MKGSGPSSPKVPSTVACTHCGGELEARLTVWLNDRPFHVESCFGEGLKADLADVTIAMGAGMDPAVAYRAGAQSRDLIVASLRKKARRK